MVHSVKSVTDLVGHTPLVELQRFTDVAGGTVATLWPSSKCLIQEEVARIVSRYK